MTLNTSLIERESRELYMRYIKDPRIPDELCSEIYLEFLDRMREYRQKQEKKNGKKHIEGGIIGTIIRKATHAVFHKENRGEVKDQVLTEIINRNAS